MRKIINFIIMSVQQPILPLKRAHMIHERKKRGKKKNRGALRAEERAALRLKSAIWDTAKTGESTRMRKALAISKGC
jgi:hypothetical protein